MHIGEFAKGNGVTVQTVRFYERSGLLPAPHRKESGYRTYSYEDVRRLSFIKQAKKLGFSLHEIREILRTRERGKCPCTDVIAIGERHLRELEDRMRELTKFRAELSGALRAGKRSGEKTLSADAFCVLIERTMKKPMRRSAQRLSSGHSDGRKGFSGSRT